jgi:arylsulfatase A-like enzyme
MSTMHIETHPYLIMAAAAVFLLAGTGVSLATPSPSGERPHLLVIITDQQHAGMMRCAGNRWLRTPALDALAARGVRFERAYCGNPVCVPSRFGMMTGVMPSRIGIDRNVGSSHPVAPGILAHAMGTVFGAAGYRTVYGGKVHLPGTKERGVAAYGFTETLTGDERENLAAACASFFAGKHDKPFLLVASFINPHDICYMAIDAHAHGEGREPLYPRSVRERQCLAEALRLPVGFTREEFFEKQCPPLPGNFEITQGEPPAARRSAWRAFRRYVQENWTAEDWRLHRWAYARLTERVDAHIGTVLDGLRAAGLEQDTVVVFTSDHGDMDAAHRLEHKSMPYEEATRVPLIVSRPEMTAAGHVDTTHLVSTTLDLIPTLCDFAGIPVPEALAGRSVKPLAVAPRERRPWREYLVAENEGSRVLWTGRHKYAVYEDGQPRELLIDLAADPGEMRNLAATARPGTEKLLQRHRRLLRAWYAENRERLDEKYLVANEAASEAALPWKAGIASAVITPDEPLPMAGYAARKEPAEGTEQDLFAKALAVEDRDGHRLVILTVDLIGVRERLRTVVAGAVQTAYKLPPHALLMNASHTHCGPAYERTEATTYREGLTRTLVTLVGQAIDDLQGARLAYSRARCGFAMNRRTPAASGYRNHPNPEGVVDHTVPVLSVRDAAGSLRAVLFGYACHNTTMGFRKWLGDYAGYAKQYFEEDHPGVTALFLMGCGADQNPYPRSKLPYAQKHGRALATAVEAALEAGQKTLRHQHALGGPLRTALETVDLQFTDPDRSDFPYPVQIVRFGDDLSLIALGNEVVVDYALRLKRELTEPEGPAVWVAGYSNVYAGYIPSRRVLEEGGYEAESRPWKPTLEERIVAKVHELHTRLAGDPQTR